MKKIILLLLVFWIAGCITTKESSSVFEDTEVIGCPDLIKYLASNLENLGVDQDKVNTWMESTLSKQLQPCNVCERMSEASVTLIDDDGNYRAAMTKLIQTMEESDPNTEPQPEKQKKKINSAIDDNNNEDGYDMAGEYINALEELEFFLVTEMKFPTEEAKNFILDNFMIPLLNQQPDASEP